MIGQPPRSKGKGFDQHEQEVWFDQIYRYLKGLSTTTNTETTTDGGTGETTIVQGGSTTITNIIGGKRYLRWLGI
jgi:hypothetical protein